MIGITCRTIDRFVTQGFQIGYDPTLMSASNQKVHVLSSSQISISFQSKSANEGVIDSFLFEETDQGVEYRFYIQDKLNIRKKDRGVNKKKPASQLTKRLKFIRILKIPKGIGCLA